MTSGDNPAARSTCETPSTPCTALNQMRSRSTKLIAAIGTSSERAATRTIRSKTSSAGAGFPPSKDRLGAFLRAAGRGSDPVRRYRRDDPTLPADRARRPTESMTMASIAQSDMAVRVLAEVAFTEVSGLVSWRHDPHRGGSAAAGTSTATRCPSGPDVAVLAALRRRVPASLRAGFHPARVAAGHHRLPVRSGGDQEGLRRRCCDLSCGRSQFDAVRAARAGLGAGGRRGGAPRPSSVDARAVHPRRGGTPDRDHGGHRGCRHRRLAGRQDLPGGPSDVEDHPRGDPADGDRRQRPGAAGRPARRPAAAAEPVGVPAAVHHLPRPAESPAVARCSTPHRRSRPPALRRDRRPACRPRSGVAL